MRFISLRSTLYNFICFSLKNIISLLLLFIIIRSYLNIFALSIFDLISYYRSFWFLREFLHQFSTQPNPNLTNSVSKAYDITLSRYHNWFIRGVFSIAMGGLPKTDDFLRYNIYQIIPIFNISF
jgi:hypothetical protein